MLVKLFMLAKLFMFFAFLAFLGFLCIFYFLRSFHIPCFYWFFAFSSPFVVFLLVETLYGLGCVAR